MKEHNRKENIDIDIIKKEIIKMCNTSIKNKWLFFIAEIPLVILIWLMVYTNSSVVALLIPIAIALMIFFLIMFEIVYCIVLKNKIRQDKFSISVKRMISQSRPEFLGSTTHPSRYLAGQIYSKVFNFYKFKLVFENKETYYMPVGKNYEWSELYCMDHIQIYENSKYGDEFYLVKDNNDKIIIAYNTRYFELHYNNS